MKGVHYFQLKTKNVVLKPLATVEKAFDGSRKYFWR